MRLRLFIVASFLGLLVSSSPVFAVEILTFFDTQCAPRSGVLLRVDETRVHFVALDGTVGELSREGITAIVTYRTLENPLARITLLGSTRLLLRDVWLGNDETPAFAGWPVGFFENLIVFLDLEGTTHVLEREDIEKIRVIRRSIPGEVRPKLFAPVELGIPNGLIPCRTSSIAGSIRPTRAIGDPIKVSEYLAKLAELFREVDGFEERTRVYARPFLFDRTMRLGLSYLRKGGNGIPLYFQWASGRPYRFQSLTAIGRISNPSLPHAGPSLSVRSDLKSHFFHAYFAGHLPSLAAGSSAFVANELIPRYPGRGAVDDLYNYLMLMGGDWGPWSLSVGTLYRNFRLGLFESQERELTAEAASKVVRLGMTGRSYALRLLYFRTRQSRDEGSTGNYNSIPTQHQLRMDTVRAGVTWEPKAWLQLGADEIFSRGQYWEGNAQGQTKLKIFQAMTHLFVRQTFSDYISVMALVTFRQFHNSTTPDLGIKSFADYDLGGAIEFLF
jgi:hypothetical protein